MDIYIDSEVEADPIISDQIQIYPAAADMGKENFVLRI